MTILRPVTQCLPQSTKISEQSNLPFAFVLSPYAKNSLLDCTSESIKQGLNENKEESNKQEVLSTSLLPADSVPKCGTCGAPINPCALIRSYPSKPTSDATRTRVLKGEHKNNEDYDDDDDDNSSNEDEEGEESTCYGSFLCALCGTITTLHQNIQAALHPTRSGKELYVARFQENAQRASAALEEKRRLFSQSGGWRSRVNLRNERRHRDEDTAYIHKHLSSELYPECKNHIMEFSVPLFPSSSTTKPVMEMNAKDCPTILTAVILDHAPDRSIPGYFTSVCESIRLAIENAPSHAKIAIFLASNCNITSFDLSSPTPHLKHIRLPQTTNKSRPDFHSTEDNNTDVVLEDELLWNQTYISCTSENKSHIEAVLRALEDSLVLNAACRPHWSTAKTKEPKIPNLGQVLHYLFNYLECGLHPGDLTSPNVPSDPIQEYRMCYAGGKVMVFLPQAPLEIGDVVVENGTFVGTGGFGGSCARVGRRYAANIEREHSQYLDGSQNGNGVESDTKVEEIEKEEDQINAEFIDYFFTEKKDIADWYVDLGSRAANLAMGIEIFAIQEEENFLKTKSFGFPLLKLLSDKSGGCGPLLLCLKGESNVYDRDVLESFGDNGTTATLFREVQARCPWER